MVDVAEATSGRPAATKQGEAPPEGLFPGATLIATGVALVTLGGAQSKLSTKPK